VKDGQVVLGRAVGAHGLQGQVRVRIFGDGLENLARHSDIWLADSEDDPKPRSFAVQGVGSGRAREARVALAGIEDRDAAEELKGLLVLGTAEVLEPLPEGEYYWHELVGCRVETREGRIVGTVREIWETGAHDVLVVKDEDGRQQLISTARELVPEIDPKAGRIVVEAIPGLLESEFESEVESE
jgi:16S rRNA processing protein RimM